MPHDIFISYSRKNKDAVLPIKNEIEQRLGLTCWIDLSDIPSGAENFKEKVIPGINGTSIAFLFFLSKEVQESEYALKEIGFAKKRAKKRVILVRFNDDEMTDEFYFDYQNSDIIDWRIPEQKGKLLRNLSEWSPHAPSSGSRQSNTTETLDFGKALAQHLDKWLPWQKFRLITGIQFKDNNGNVRMTGHVVGSQWGVFLIGYETSQNLAESRAATPHLPSENEIEEFAALIADRCEVSREDVKYLFAIPGNLEMSNLPNWALPEFGVIDYLKRRMKKPDELNWEKNHREIIKALESLPMTHFGRESNILKHFKAGTLDEIEDGAALLAWADDPSEQLLDAAEEACKSLWRFGNGRAAEGVRAWFRVMADRGNVLAMDHYGWLLDGSDNERVLWFRKAAELGGAHAQNSLGYCLQTGKGVQQNRDEAIKWFKASAAQGNRYGQASLAGAYANQAFAGLPPNRDEAFRLYRLSAEQGLHDGQYHLGECYEKGIGTPKNLAEARRWYEKAAKQGKEEAQKAIERLETCRTLDFGMGAFKLRKIPGKEPQPAFWMGETPVTQAQWAGVMGNNPSVFKGDDQRPVENVSWDDCQTFLTKLNALNEIRQSGLSFRLPTAEEWEYACRAGGEGPYCRLKDETEITEETLGLVAWFSDNSDGTTHPVGQKEPNAWGLYDIHGNVGEWTQTADGDKRIERGGSWKFPAQFCFASGWGSERPSDRHDNLGFRLCASFI